MIFHNKPSTNSRFMTRELRRRVQCRGGSWDFLKVELVPKLFAFKTISCTFLQRMYLRYRVTNTFIQIFSLIFVKISCGLATPSSPISPSSRYYSFLPHRNLRALAVKHRKIVPSSASRPLVIATDCYYQLLQHECVLFWEMPTAT